MKVGAHGCCVSFSPIIINEYPGRSKLVTADKVPPLKIIAQEITSRVFEDYPSKGLLPTSSLSVKYAMLNRIGVSKWAPIDHNLGITTYLARLIYKIGTRTAFYLGEYAFD